MIAWDALFAALVFVVIGLSVIPLDRALEQRRQHRHRNQATRIDRW